MGFFSKISRFVDDVLLLPDEARELAEQARGHLDAGEPALALEAATAALNIRADHPQLLTLAGEALSRLGELSEAEKLLREAIELDADHAPARVSLARLIRRKRGDLEEATEQLRRAAAVLVAADERGAAVEALRDLARCYVDLRRPDRAARELRKALSLGADDPSLQLSLAQVLLDDDQRGAARAAARRALGLVEGSEDGPLLKEAGEIALRAGLDEEAGALFERALTLGEKVHLQLCRVALRRGDGMAAHEHALRAMVDHPSSAEPHRLRAEMALKAGDRRGALAALEAALSLEPDHLETLEAALSTAAQVNLKRAGELAGKVLWQQPGSSLARAIRARAAIAEGRESTGEVELELRELRERAPEQVELWLALAELAVAKGQGEQALEALERVEATAPTRPELERRGAEACRLVASAGSGVEPDLFDVLERVHALIAVRKELSELGVEVGRIREDYDKPLLLTVMGEFNAGKSTFINALVGEPVAPMGITPTTATINVLKYGPERKVRVFHRTGTVKELAYEDLGGWLKGLSREAAVEVRQVEILYPAEELTRVNLVDTPGFNSIVPEHELVARRYIERADAVVWLFDAGQPGKASEQQALQRIREQKKGVLGVLNKADRLPREALERVLEHLEGEELTELVTEFVPLSARAALMAKQGEETDEGALIESGLPRLQERLEAVFYSKARQIKRAGCASRLVVVLEQAIERESAANAALRRGAAEVADVRLALASLSETLAPEAVELLRERLEEVLGRVADDAAAEVLEFVRPRRHRLDSHRFSPEDRRYLIELIEGRLVGAMEALSGRLSALAVEAIEGLWAPLAALEDEVGVLTTVEALGEGEEFGRSLAWAVLSFQRGLVRGGRADRFFDDVLPRLELERGEIGRRIERWWAGVDAEAQEAVTRGVEELSRRLARRLSSEAAHLRAELARRRRAGALPLSGFASLAREWAAGS